MHFFAIPKIRRLAVILAGFAFFPPAVLSDDFDNEFDEKPRTEIEVQLPPFPEKENLIPFEVGAVRNQQFFIDGHSISVGSDEVIRYTLVVIGSGGAQNITFEGMRCTTGEFRVYAFGRSDKTWSRARNDKWGKIPPGSNRVHANLFSDYFCSVGERAIFSPDDARNALRYSRSTTFR
jgi:CNP1-like family.